LLGAETGLKLQALPLGTESGVFPLKLFLSLGIALGRLLFYIGAELGIGLIRSRLALGLCGGFSSGITHCVETFGLPPRSQSFLFLACLILTGFIRLRSAQHFQRARVLGWGGGGCGQWSCDDRSDRGGCDDWSSGHSGDRDRRGLCVFGLAQGFQ
jgi:hypothetical protein